MQRFLSWLNASFVRNPGIWILFGLLLIAEYGNWQRGEELSRLCELLGDHDISVGHPRTAREEIDNICISRRPSDD
jgi:hypothetical protein